jgi:hypothetical protein
MKRASGKASAKIALPATWSLCQWVLTMYFTGFGVRRRISSVMRREELRMVPGIHDQHGVVADHHGGIAAHDRLAGRLDEGVDAVGDLHRVEGERIRRGEGGRATPLDATQHEQEERAQGHDISSVRGSLPETFAVNRGP